MADASEVAGQHVELNGFIYREGEGVSGPWMKFGKQGAKGRRTELVTLSRTQLDAIQLQVEHELKPSPAVARIHAELIAPAELLYRQDPEACRKLYPQYYRDLFVAHSHHGDLFDKLAPGRLWPDEVLESWISMSRQGVRPKEYIHEDLASGVISQPDFDRLLEMLKELS